MIENEFTIQEPKNSLLLNIFIAFVLAIYFSLCYYFYNRNDNKNQTVYFLILLGYILFAYIIIPGLRQKSIHVNFSMKKIKYETDYLFFKIKKKWETLENLEYISVFNNKNVYEVNLWHTKNKIINLFVDPDINEVIRKAFIFSDKLDLDLLDATRRGHHKWIDKKIYKSTGQIKYLN